MKYYSTNHISPKVGFREATICGLAPDGGLYFPERIPMLSSGFVENPDGCDYRAEAFQLMRHYVGDAIPDSDLQRIVEETINFDFPLVQVAEDAYSLELFHGPTLAFKDVGARFMSRCLGYFMRDSKQKVTVLVATSGDTGGAA